jgi:hypothetical protein
MSLFLSVDPLVESTMDPYGYCYQNPLKFVDPTGMAPTDDYKLYKDGTLKKIKTTDDDFDVIYNEDETKSIKVDKKIMKNKKGGGAYNSELQRIKASETTFELKNSSVSNEGLKEFYNFLADNSAVEWGYDQLYRKGYVWDDNVVIIASQHKTESVSSTRTINYLKNGSFLGNEYKLVDSGHSHPNMTLYGNASRINEVNYPSGFERNGTPVSTFNRVSDRETFIKMNGDYPGRIPNSNWIRTGNNSKIHYNGTRFWRK